MKIRFFLIILGLAILMTACAETDTTEDIKFKVISDGGNFAGSYSVDSGTSISFTGVSLGNDIYSYEKELEIEDQIEIEADAINNDDDTNDLESLEIKIYVDDKLKKEIKDTATVEKITLTYETD